MRVTLFFLLMVTGGCLASVDGEVTRFRMAISADGWQEGKQPRAQPLLDVPTRYLGNPPEVVKELYRKRVSKGRDGRLAVGTLYLKFDAAEFHAAGEPVEGQVSVVPKDQWPRSVMETVNVETSRYQGNFDPALNLNRQQKVAVSPHADFVFYTDPEAPNFVWIQCRYEDELHVDIDDVGRCSMHVNPADYIAASIRFDSHELPLWRERADRLHQLVQQWIRPESEWPPLMSEERQ